MDAGAAAVKGHVKSGAERVVASTAAAVTQVNGHVDNRYDAQEAELGRLRKIVTRLIVDDVLQTPRARQLVREEVSRAPDPPLLGSAVACVSLNASERADLPAPPPLCACRSACWRTGFACVPCKQPGDWRACTFMCWQTSASLCCRWSGS